MFCKKTKDIEGVEPIHKRSTINEFEYLQFTGENFNQVINFLNRDRFYNNYINLLVTNEIWLFFPLLGDHPEMGARFIKPGQWVQKQINNGNYTSIVDSFHKREVNL